MTRYPFRAPALPRPPVAKCLFVTVGSVAAAFDGVRLFLTHTDTSVRR